MGDRANVFVQDYDRTKGVFLYTHWTGTGLPETVRTALAKRKRWDDGQYLARIIFCEMVKGRETEETGFGITATCGDGGRRVLIVDPQNELIAFGDEESAFNDLTSFEGHMTFEEFIAKPQAWPGDDDD